MAFCGICRRQGHYEFQKVFQKSFEVFCAKAKKVNPIKFNFSITKKCSDSTQIFN